VQEKIKAGYYPQENGDKKPLSKWHRRHPEPEQGRKFGAVRTRRQEGSEKKLNQMSEPYRGKSGNC